MTGKLLWQVTMSLDGFIAGPGGDMTWMSGSGGPNPVAYEVMSKIGALLIGGRTYHLDDNSPATERSKPYGGAWTGPMFVLTGEDPAEAAPGFTFLSGDIGAAVAAAKDAAGEKYVNILGANVAKRCLAAGLLEEILVHVAPVLVGDGVRLFDQPGFDSLRLEPISLTTTDKVANMWLRVPARATP
ncbi:MAG TPA: dihydrofolate reductase family protein [Pseudonocardiaceae bacterium]|nr:dihydrofolate reductase family protein [Pseudonocardiaceae bacterium]